jgi:hypothetical protein
MRTLLRLAMFGTGRFSEPLPEWNQEKRTAPRDASPISIYHRFFERFVRRQLFV